MSVVLYHYTTLEGFDGIFADGYIRPSDGKRDARYGVGVYLTSKSPHKHSMDQISRNNFDGRARAWKAQKTKVKVALEFRFEAHEVEQKATKRDVWLYEDGELELDEYFTGRMFVGGPGGYEEHGEWYM